MFKDRWPCGVGLAGRSAENESYDHDWTVSHGLICGLFGPLKQKEK